ncbi:hypothetical protein RFI_30053 [Reticulomyxa filosa]|uniref:Uncharacterized protein n=1 Tax=Reticulomyxa filosa TaxID=46433 RepID=X6M1P4_RETFI|nr:hypothetical protein RFI_30053 [Reticulomyxa filosa]|eukprot:ETO07337.1 hypothetical protein RFI_30053 [Reticulomyxa filosa]
MLAKILNQYLARSKGPTAATTTTTATTTVGKGMPQQRKQLKHGKQIENWDTAWSDMRIVSYPSLAVSTFDDNDNDNGSNNDNNPFLNHGDTKLNVVTTTMDSNEGTIPDFPIITLARGLNSDTDTDIDDNYKQCAIMTMRESDIEAIACNTYAMNEEWNEEQMKQCVDNILDSVQNKKGFSKKMLRNAVTEHLGLDAKWTKKWKHEIDRLGKDYVRRFNQKLG